MNGKRDLVRDRRHTNQSLPRKTHAKKARESREEPDTDKEPRKTECQRTATEAKQEAARNNKEAQKKKGKPNKATLNLYMSWPDKETADLYSLILFLDSTTPPIFNSMGSVGWVPTISLTSHLRAFPSDGPLKVSAKTDFLTSGFIEEDREIWDSKGNLVGQSKQLAKLRLKK